MYPWGDDFIADNAVYANNSGGKTAPVGSRPGSASWVGALDMSGNVWEWVSSLYLPYPYEAGEAENADDTNSLRVLRGGSWFNFDSNLRAPLRLKYYPIDDYYDYGFRCARSQ
jgi:formylglycine-generating enzyme required for sulfatase activity